MNVKMPPPEADPAILSEAARTRSLTESGALAVASIVLAVEVVNGLATRGLDEASRAVLLDVLLGHYRGTMRRLAVENET